MPSEIIVALIAAAAPTLTAAAAWVNLRGRTNGKGPLGQELKEVKQRLDTVDLHLRDVIRWQVDHVMSDHERRN